MKTQRRHLGALEFINDILLARARLAQAKNDLALAEAQARAAKRRGEENKPNPGLTWKKLWHAEREFIRARVILAKMEKKYFAAVRQAVQKPAKSRLTVGEAVGDKPPLAQAKRSMHSAVRAIKEKKPVAVFRSLLLASSRAATGTSGRQGSITRP
jgi:hypothetical protein